MKEWQKAVINAAIMAGISFLSMVIANGEVTVKTFCAASIAGGITFLSLCARYFRPPEGDVNDQEACSIPTFAPGDTDQASVKKGKILSLWVI